MSPKHCSFVTSYSTETNKNCFKDNSNRYLSKSRQKNHPYCFHPQAFLPTKTRRTSDPIALYANASYASATTPLADLYSYVKKGRQQAVDPGASPAWPGPLPNTPGLGRQEIDAFDDHDRPLPNPFSSRNAEGLDYLTAGPGLLTVPASGRTPALRLEGLGKVRVLQGRNKGVTSEALVSY